MCGSHWHKAMNQLAVRAHRGIALVEASRHDAPAFGIAVWQWVAGEKRCPASEIPGFKAAIGEQFHLCLCRRRRGKGQQQYSHKDKSSYKMR